MVLLVVVRYNVWSTAGINFRSLAIHDIFYFTTVTEITNYADDKTPNVIEENIESIIAIFQKDISIIIKWFQDNYFKLNAYQCHFLESNHCEMYIYATLQCNDFSKLLLTSIVILDLNLKMT